MSQGKRDTVTLGFGEFKTRHYVREIIEARRIFGRNYTRLRWFTSRDLEPPVHEETLVHLLVAWQTGRRLLTLLRPCTDDKDYGRRESEVIQMEVLLREAESLPAGYVDALWRQRVGGVRHVLQQLENGVESVQGVGVYLYIQRYYTEMEWFRLGLEGYTRRCPHVAWPHVSLDGYTQAHIHQILRREKSRFGYDSTYPSQMWWYHLA